MSDDEAIDRLASDLEDRWREVATLSDSLVVGKFSNLPPTPERLLVAMSEALRLPHRLVEEIDVDWNDAVVTFSQECNSIGVFSCRLRCAAVAVEQRPKHVGGSLPEREWREVAGTHPTFGSRLETAASGV